MFGFPFSIISLLFFLFIIGIPAVFIMRGKRQSASNEPIAKKRFFSFDLIIDKILRLLERFPITILLVVGFAVLCFMEINDAETNYRLWIFFSVGAFLSAAATLFAEDFWNRIKRYGITIFMVVLWGVYCYFLPEETDNLHLSKKIEMWVIGVSAFLAMFFISFLKNGSDRTFWNFATQTLSQMVVAVFFGAVIFGGLSLAVVAIDSLFSVRWIDNDIYANLAICCFVLFTPFYFLSNIPDKANKHNNELTYNKIQKIFALYILTPILAIYAVILYVYLIQIIIEWQLPRGMVSWLVTALALGGLLVTALLYPVREAKESKVALFLGRWFGVIILPLLVLMTIGIFRRIGDHGITINRIYILLLNLWFYGIYAYLFFTHSRKIKWILISPVVIALVVSTSVWGVANFTQRTLTNEIRSHFGDTQLSVSEARIMLSEMEQADRERVGSVLEYMHRTFGRESVRVFFTQQVSSGVRSFMESLGLREDIDTHIVDFGFSAQTAALPVIEGYNTFVEIHRWNTSFRDDGLIAITIPYKDHTIYISTREMLLEFLALDEDKRRAREWVIRGDDYAVVVVSFFGTYNEENDEIVLTSFLGYLFFNR